MPKKLFISILAISLAGSVPSPAEDLTIVFKRGGSGGEGQTTRYFSATRARFDEGEEAAIVDFASGRILKLKLAKKQYRETSFAEIEHAMTSMSAEMEKAMAGIPEGMRKKMVGDAREVTVSAGGTREVAGIPCRNYTLTLGEKTHIETCVATSLTPPFDPTQAKNLALLAAPAGPGNAAINKLVERMREIPGLSLASSTSFVIPGRRIETFLEATEVRTGPIEAGIFEIPPDFKKVNLPWP